MHLSKIMCLCTCSIVEELQNLSWLIHLLKTLAEKQLGIIRVNGDQERNVNLTLREVFYLFQNKIFAELL